MDSTNKDSTYSQIDILVKAFEEAHYTPANFWLAHLEERILSYPDDPAAPQNCQHQRVLINRALRVILSTIPDSFDARLALIDCCAEKVWISAIKQYVIPFIKEKIVLN